MQKVAKIILESTGLDAESYRLGHSKAWFKYKILHSTLITHGCFLAVFFCEFPHGKPNSILMQLHSSFHKISYYCKRVEKFELFTALCPTFPRFNHTALKKKTFIQCTKKYPQKTLRIWNVESQLSSIDCVVELSYMLHKTKKTYLRLRKKVSEKKNTDLPSSLIAPTHRICYKTNSPFLYYYY